jgi:hypothetical protein
MKFGWILFQTSSDQSVVTEIGSSFTIILLECVQFHVHDLIFFCRLVVQISETCKGAVKYVRTKRWLIGVDASELLMLVVCQRAARNFSLFHRFSSIFSLVTVRLILLWC